MKHIFKTRPFTLFSLFALIAVPAVMFAASAEAGRLKVVDPDSLDYRNSDSSIKFKANPTSQAIQGLQDEVTSLKAAMKQQQKMIQTLEAKNQELMQTTTLQGTTIITLREQIQIQDQKVNGIINCGASGETFTGRRCISPKDMR